jgi:hypothetical protein
VFSGCTRKRNRLNHHRITFGVAPGLLKQKQRPQRLSERIHQGCLVPASQAHHFIS